MSNNISPHISYREATFSPTATRNGWDNNPNPEQLAAMKIVAAKCFEPLREWYGKPIRIASFFRGPKLNAAVGSTPGSHHPRGMAIDIDADHHGPTENAKLFKWLIENTKWTQVIWEAGTDQSPEWVHIAYETGRENRKRITRFHPQAMTKYLHFDTVDPDPHQHYLKACAVLGITPI